MIFFPFLNYHDFPNRTNAEGPRFLPSKYHRNPSISSAASHKSKEPGSSHQWGLCSRRGPVMLARRKGLNTQCTEPEPRSLFSMANTTSDEVSADSFNSSPFCVHFLVAPACTGHAFFLEHWERDSSVFKVSHVIPFLIIFVFLLKLKFLLGSSSIKTRDLSNYRSL